MSPHLRFDGFPTAHPEHGKFEYQTPQRCLLQSVSQHVDTVSS
ncbi:Uncharacterised protein [Vibrio cholerae]|nr:Uncharacterised protein [Vibrio cholerae]